MFKHYLFQNNLRWNIFLTALTFLPLIVNAFHQKNNFQNGGGGGKQKFFKKISFTWLAVACSNKLLNSVTFFCSVSCQASEAHNKARDLPEPG